MSKTLQNILLFVFFMVCIYNILKPVEKRIIQRFNNSYERIYVRFSLQETKRIDISNITITSYSNKDDTITRQGINVLINGDYSNYIQQMVQKLIAKVDTQGVKDIFSDELSLDQFKTQLHYYCYASLDGFYNAYQTCLDLFVEAKISEPESDKTLYDKFYKPRH